MVVSVAVLLGFLIVAIEIDGKQLLNYQPASRLSKVPVITGKSTLKFFGELNGD
jgi:hypothetical protein